jgi:hypothetical protein
VGAAEDWDVNEGYVRAAIIGSEHVHVAGNGCEHGRMLSAYVQRTFCNEATEAALNHTFHSQQWYLYEWLSKTALWQFLSYYVFIISQTFLLLSSLNLVFEYEDDWI